DFLKIGYSVSITDITLGKMAYAKSAGIDYVETSFGPFIVRHDKQEPKLKFSDEKIIKKVKKAKEIAENAGIDIWSIHMPFGKNIDLSIIDELERREVIAFQKKILEYAKILDPEIILFHPSWFLGLNEREERINQLVESVRELNRPVRKMSATMVIE